MAQQARIDKTGNRGDGLILGDIEDNFTRSFGQGQILAAAYTLVSQTGVQQIFNGTTNGQILLPLGVYEFECQFTLSSMSASSGSFGFALGANNGLVIGSQLWTAFANKATLATAAQGYTTTNTTANTALTAAGTGTVGVAEVNGVFRVTTVGNLQPQVSLGVAAAAVVGINSYFRIWQRSTLSTDVVFGQPMPNSNGMNWS